MKYIGIFLLLLFSTLLLAAATPIADNKTGNVQCLGGLVSKNKCPEGYELNDAPVITLVGNNSVTYVEGDSYVESGATCLDNQDGTIVVPSPTFNPTLNMNLVGTYIATYTCTDAGGLTDTVNRTVNVNSASAGVAFANADSLIDASPDITQAFYAGMPDVNGDGCLDLYIGAHEDTVNSNMLIQDNVGGACQGTFTHFPDNENYSQSSPATPRITSRYIFGNWYNHPLGMWSFYGADVDGSASARYVLDPTFTTVGGQPQYLPKDMGCYGARPKCWIADVDGGGDFEMVSRLFSTPYNTGYVKDLSGNVLYTPTSNSGTFTQGLTVADFDNDGYVEFLSMEEAGWFNFNPAGPSVDWEANKLDNPFLEAHDRHNVVFDYDRDGDLDLFMMEVAYNTSDPTGGIPKLWRNNGDGTLTDVSATAFASMPTIPILTGASSYANSIAADFDNDGYPDLVYMLENYNNAITLIKNNGDGTFTKTNDFGIDVTPGGNFGANSDRPWVNYGDFNNDGLVDLVHNGTGAGGAVVQGHILRNVTNTSNHWMKIRVRGEGANTDGLHTRLTFFEPGTTNIVTYYHTGVFSMGYQNLITHAGLGANTTVDIRAEFPHGGPVCNFPNVAADQDYIIFRSCNIQSYTPGSAIPLTYVASNSINTTSTLVADSTITPSANEQVTFAITFPENTVLSTDEIKVSIAGSEVAVAVDSIVNYQGSKTGIRSARIQIPSVDMTGGNVVVSITDEGSGVARATFNPQTSEFATASLSKSSMPFKRIWAKHDLAYIQSTGIIPPYAITTDLDAAYTTYAAHQFDNWAEPFDYSTSTQANWLFDRAGALYKLYLQFGDTKYLKEAFLAFRYYISNIQLTGTVATGRGGWIGDTVDDKYAYSEAVLIHYALTGDDTWLPEGDTVNAVVEDMAFRALDYSEQGSIYTSTFSNGAGYESEREFFTERRTGLTLWGASVACGMTGNTTLCNRVNGYILDLKDHQQGVDSFDTLNGWDTKTGALVHSWLMHECPGCFASRETDVPLGSDADRRFSPWMSSNIQSALWTMYWTLDDTLISNRTELPEMIRYLAEGVHNYGLDPSPIGASSSSHGFKAYTTSRSYTYGDMTFCDATDSSPFVLYTAAPYATQAELFDPVPYTGSDTGTFNYPDNRSSTHYGEVMGLLASGLYFETDPTKRTQLETTIGNLSDVYTTACSTWFAGQGIPRAFNWQFFTNPRATYDWVRLQ